MIRMLTVSGLLLSAAAVSADDSRGVKLFRPDSLVGWDYAAEPPAGWTVADGKLSGSGEATPLLSGFSFGDFELRFGWSAAEGGAWEFRLPDVPSGDGLRVVFCEGDECARIVEGDKSLAPGSRLEPAEGGGHTASIRRSGGKLAVLVDEKQLAEADVKTDRRFGLGLALAGGKGTLSDPRLQEPPGEPMVQGEDLSGWWCPGKMAAWSVEDGELVLTSGGGNYLRSEKLYGNFTLSMELKAKKGANSGVGIRTPRDGWPSGDGMELQIEDRPHDVPLDKHQEMAIYGNVPPLARADESEVYNRIVIKADGWIISAWVNGELVQHVNTEFHPELKHRNLAGWIGFQDHGSWIRVRNLRVLEAPEGEGLQAWHRPPPPRAGTAMLDRLMNPHTVAVDRGIRSGLVTTKVAGENPAEHVLAELTGPGAVVRVGRSNDQGRLAFYFDGEEKPRLECKPQDFWHAGPEVTENREPVLTCLVYAKTLKVVLREAESVEYRIEYVTFPKGIAAETFSGPESSFPRGWLSAVKYRHGYGRWGRIREHDPMPRFASEKKTIEPGETHELLRVDGAGVVRWTRLAANKKVLAGDDLWLEAAVDGEAEAAVAAPARFWFAALTGQGGYNNFLVGQRGGFLSRLPLPFGKGITFSAKNAGEEPIAGVGLDVCVDREPDEGEHLMRLRGVYLPAGEGTSVIIRREGPGRWVGLVYDEPEGMTTGIAGLEIDGQAVDGWAAPSLDPFLGRSGDFRACLSGRQNGLAWRYMLLAPVDFQQSLVLGATTDQLGGRLGLFYVEP